jgi:hypothetical protein
LPHIQISLDENIFEALMVSINIALGAHKMMSPNLESMNNSVTQDHELDNSAHGSGVLWKYKQLPGCSA